MWSTLLVGSAVTLFVAQYSGRSSALKCGQIPILSGNGNARADYRIIGGENAIKGEFPWQVALFHQGIQVCGASIIDRKWTITAAHCVKKNNGVYSVRAGEYNLKGPEGIEQEVEVLRIIRHQDYDVKSYDNDIAILELTSKLNYTKYIQPICLPEPQEFPKRGIECHITGWGKVSAAVPRSTILQKITLPVNDFQECKKQFDIRYPAKQYGSELPRVNSNMICAGFPEGGIDACKGDSGGPMACHKKIGNAMVLYGLTSWGMGCGQELPGYYTRVGNYIEWIRRILDGKPSENMQDPCNGPGILIKDQKQVAIESKGYDGTSEYAANLHCTWTIEIAGSRDSHYAVLKFDKFDVEDDAICDFDYVKVFTGDETDALIGTFCGQSIPAPLTSAGSLKFKIVFHSDDSTNLKGFQARINRFQKDTFVESNCGSLGSIRTRRKKLFASKGVITSAQYPENYAPGSDCEWSIRTTPGRSIQLTFEDFGLEVPDGNNECTSDSVVVYNAKSTVNGKKIGKPICGSYDKSFRIATPGRHVTMKFTSDNESESRGFKVSYLTFEDSTTKPNVTTPRSLEAIARSQSDELDTDDGDCGFSAFEITYDKVRKSSPLVEGEEIAANSIPWTAHVYYCFRTSKSNETSCKICDGTLVDKKWVITVAHCFEEDSYLISVTVGLGDHDKSVFEKSEATVKVKRVVKYPTYNQTLLPVNDIALVEFQEAIKTFREIRPVCLPSPDVCFPPGTVCMSVGWGGPATYGADSRKLRRAQVPLYNDDSCAAAVGKDIYHKSVLCGGLKRGPNHKDQCGPEAGGGLLCRSSPSQPWILYGIVSCGYGCISPGSPSLYTKITELSDWITNTMGKNVTRPPTTKRTSCEVLSRKEQELKNYKNPCFTAQTLQDSSGEIVSDNYPEPYQNNLECLWTIISPDPEKLIEITFDDVDVEGDENRCWDEILIRRADGSNIRYPVCNEHEPAFPYFLKGNASIRFTSDGSGQFRGFKLKYRIVSVTNMTSNCDSDYLLLESGTIQSRGYPKNYPPSIYCEWLLQAKEDQAVQLNVTEIDVESENGCHFDFVELYDSDAEGNQTDRTARLCGLMDENKIYQSKGEFMLVKFKSDASGSARGFSARFKSVIVNA